MIELNKVYSTQDIATELELSYGSFRNKRELYEQHLSMFYEYKVVKKGNSISYLFTEQKEDFIPYKEFKRNQKNKTVVSHIHSAIHYDPRQTGSNIARIIIVDNEIQVLGWKLSTLQVYVRAELKQLIADGYYVKTDYRWCYLDKKKNEYVLMSDKEVKKLRDYFKTKATNELEENLIASYEEGEMTRAELDAALGDLHLNNIIQGKIDYKNETGVWPMKVPIFEVNGVKA